jgi:hypothetical protein
MPGGQESGTRRLRGHHFRAGGQRPALRLPKVRCGRLSMTSGLARRSGAARVYEQPVTQQLELIKATQSKPESPKSLLN